MVKHYQKHKAADPYMDLVKFMGIHYLEPNIITDDFQQDQQLPFRSMECHMQNVTI